MKRASEYCMLTIAFAALAQPAALAALSARVKASFDPERILNRGRMREDL